MRAGWVPLRKGGWKEGDSCHMVAEQLEGWAWAGKQRAPAPELRVQNVEGVSRLPSSRGGTEREGFKRTGLRGTRKRRDCEGHKEGKGQVAS